MLVNGLTQYLYKSFLFNFTGRFKSNEIELLKKYTGQTSFQKLILFSYCYLSIKLNISPFNSIRFANFLDGGEQFTPDEIEAYESGDFSLGNSYIDRDEQPGLFSSSPRRTSGSLSSISSGHSVKGDVNRTPNGRVWISDDEDSLANLED